MRLLIFFLFISFGASGQNGNEMNGFHYFCDFISHVNADVTGAEMFASNSGSGAGTTTFQASSNRSTIGCALMTTGSTSTGRAYMGTNVGILTFSGGYWVYELQIDSISALSDGTQRYQFVAGFIDATSVNMTDGVYFVYDEGGVTTGSAASANWQCAAAEGGTREFTTTSTAVGLSKTRLRIEVAANGSEAIYYINGVEVDRNSTYIPDNPLTESTGFGVLLVKSIGATARTVSIDWLKVDATWNITR